MAPAKCGSVQKLTRLKWLLLAQSGRLRQSEFVTSECHCRVSRWLSYVSLLHRQIDEASFLATLLRATIAVLGGLTAIWLQQVDVTRNFAAVALRMVTFGCLHSSSDYRAPAISDAQ